MGIMLIAGCASTVGRLLTTLFTDTVGWQCACLAWAFLNLAIGFPLNGFLEPSPPPPLKVAKSAGGEEVAAPKLAMVLLALCSPPPGFGQHGYGGASPAGPASGGRKHIGGRRRGRSDGARTGRAGRLIEFGAMRRAHPLISARIATVFHPIGALVMVLIGGPASSVFTTLQWGWKRVADHRRRHVAAGAVRTGWI